MSITREEYTSPLFLAVTPSDTVSLPDGVRALYIGTGGNAVVVDQFGRAVTFNNLASGQVLPVQAARVNATSTTASNIVALF